MQIWIHCSVVATDFKSNVTLSVALMGFLWNQWAISKNIYSQDFRIYFYSKIPSYILNHFNVWKKSRKLTLQIFQKEKLQIFSRSHQHIKTISKHTSIPDHMCFKTDNLSMHEHDDLLMQNDLLSNSLNLNQNISFAT